MLANENHVYWLLMQVCQSNIFYSLLYCDFHPFFFVLWPFIALAKIPLGKYVGGGYGPSPTF